MNNPNFFVIGAPKCGTTALAKYLSEHPEVFMTDPKEPHHYSTDINHGKFKDKSAYLSLFNEVAKEHKAIGEASVWYLYSKDAVENILKDYPNAKFIIMLRNPVDMVSSLHEQFIFSNAENVLDFETAWSLQSERKKGAAIPYFCDDKQLLYYQDACSLGAQLERIYKIVLAKNIHTILFDDLKTDPYSTWQKVQLFLNIKDDGRTDFPVINAAKKRHSLFVKRLNDLYCHVREKIGFEGFGTGFFTAFDRWNIKERSRAPLSEVMRQELIADFSDDVSRLELLLDRDLSSWKK
jgi:hypothetical protein